MNTKLEVIRLSNDDVIATSVINCEGMTHFQISGTSGDDYNFYVFEYNGTKYEYNDAATTTLGAIPRNKIKADDSQLEYGNNFVYINGKYVYLTDCNHTISIGG